MENIVMDGHITNLLSDYVLNLLPAPQRKVVEEHAAGCLSCRLSLQQERQIGPAVRATMQSLAMPAPARLSQLMPTPPAPSPKRPAQSWSLQVAWAMLMLILFLGSWGLNDYRQKHVWGPPAPTILVITATSTTTSTATTTPTETVTSTAVSYQTEPDPAAPQPAPLFHSTPVPAGTPLASLYTGSP